MAPTEPTDLSGEHGLNITSSQTETLNDNTHNTAPQIAPESPILPPTTPEHSVSPSDALYPSWSPHSPHSLSSPDNTEHYANRALPLVPQDRLRLTCYHGPLPSQQHDSWSTLETLDAEEGPTWLDNYAGSTEGHERRAVGLHFYSVLEKPRYGRASDIRHGRGRVKKKVKRRKRSPRVDWGEMERGGGGSRESSVEVKSVESSPGSEARHDGASLSPRSEGRHESRSSSIEFDDGYGEASRDGGRVPEGFVLV